MDRTKKWWQSRTIWGSVVTVAAVVAGIFGVHIDEQTKAVLVDNVTALVSAGGAIVGALLSIYGRVKAKERIQ